MELRRKAVSVTPYGLSKKDAAHQLRESISTSGANTSRTCGPRHGAAVLVVVPAFLYAQDNGLTAWMHVRYRTD